MKEVDLIVLGIYSMVGLIVLAKQIYECLNSCDGDNQTVIMNSLKHRQSFLLNRTESKWGME